MKLNQANLLKLKLKLPAGKTDHIFWDHGNDSVSGFGLRVREGNKRSWVFQYRLAKRSRRYLIGTLAEFPKVEMARDLARDLKRQVRAGHDPLAERQERSRAAERTTQTTVETFGELIERHLDGKKGRPKTFIETARYLRKVWKPLHASSLSEITRQIVASQLTTIRTRRGGRSADLARSALSTFFTWALEQGGLCDENPVIGTGRAVDPKESRRHRVLSDEEIARIWEVAPNSDYGNIVRLLILLGQRPGELAGLTWHEIDLEGRWIRLTGDRTKNGYPHDIPLPEPAVAILAAIPRRANRDLVFGQGDDRGFQGWSKAKAKLDARAKLNEAWQLRDIRRTVITGMNDLRVAPHVVEAAVNHVTGEAKRGVAGVYNKAKYNPEKREALDLWGAHITAITAAKVDKTTGTAGRKAA